MQHHEPKCERKQHKQLNELVSRMQALELDEPPPTHADRARRAIARALAPLRATCIGCWLARRRREAEENEQGPPVSVSPAQAAIEASEERLRAQHEIAMHALSTSLDNERRSTRKEADALRASLDIERKATLKETVALRAEIDLLHARLGAIDQRQRELSEWRVSVMLPAPRAPSPPPPPPPPPSPASAGEDELHVVPLGPASSSSDSDSDGFHLVAEE